MAEQAIFHAELAPFFQRKDWALDDVPPEPANHSKALTSQEQGDEAEGRSPGRTLW